MITKKDERAINLAKKFIRFSHHRRYRMSALLFKSSRLIGFGVNNEVGSYPSYIKKVHRPNFHLHAELDCLNNIKKSAVKGSTMVIYGETKAGNLICSAPCRTCYQACYKMGVKRIVFMMNKELQWQKLQ